MNPLKSVNGAILTSLLLMAALSFALGGSGFSVQNLDRWLHIASGVTWVGLLYYFNVIQVPGLADAAADKGGPGGVGIGKYIVPRALFWFRWAAVATALSGIILIEFAFRPLGGGFMQVMALKEGFTVIGVGSWLGLIMAFNVWVLIWPNQKKVLGITPATDEQKATARNVALLASRTNFVLSLPMLMCMTGQSHGLPF
ncbi:MAG: urate hydroxylase PuuD [Gammaproteobacteria bacterium]|nr:urate hydroxylase PuuD [Gammaproteobacteria bacterium]